MISPCKCSCSENEIGLIGAKSLAKCLPSTNIEALFVKGMRPQIGIVVFLSYIVGFGEKPTLKVKVADNTLIIDDSCSLLSLEYWCLFSWR